MEVAPSGFGEDVASRKSLGEGVKGAAGLAFLGTFRAGSHQAPGPEGVISGRVPSPELYT